MTNDLAVSMAELEGESAELLPSRETLNVCSHRLHGSSSFSFGHGDTPERLNSRLNGRSTSASASTQRQHRHP